LGARGAGARVGAPLLTPRRTGSVTVASSFRGSGRFRFVLGSFRCPESLCLGQVFTVVRWLLVLGMVAGAMIVSLTTIAPHLVGASFGLMTELAATAANGRGLLPHTIIVRNRVLATTAAVERGERGAPEEEDISKHDVSQQSSEDSP
jgi:hypothetical protein